MTKSKTEPKSIGILREIKTKDGAIYTCTVLERVEKKEKDEWRRDNKHHKQSFKISKIQVDRIYKNSDWVE